MNKSIAKTLHNRITLLCGMAVVASMLCSSCHKEEEEDAPDGIIEGFAVPVLVESPQLGTVDNGYAEKSMPADGGVLEIKVTGLKDGNDITDTDWDILYNRDNALVLAPSHLWWYWPEWMIAKHPDTYTVPEEEYERDEFVFRHLEGFSFRIEFKPNSERQTRTMHFVIRASPYYNTMLDISQPSK